MLNAYWLYIVARKLYQWHIPIIPKIIKLLIFLIYNSAIPYTAKIGKGSRFGYGGIGVVVHNDAVIGVNCDIGSNITIGGKKGSNGVPAIGDNVELATGCRIIGNLKIGDNSIVGANAVVVKDVPSNVVVAGVPAKIIKHIN
ncbi:serine O-acetyltransferase [Ancylomarina subtilis]|uniref:Serine O-acetyltransferase n=1 Tax=Ancylomarina subtilis TaxID=1639035 RepID=A0A4Q7VJV5_9BACT|nr:serine acetyltransferase [Ancylomarina subtilis]RZT96496.1 serine O-acetyltransferase [Ancylomarina subtilis]